MKNLSSSWWGKDCNSNSYHWLYVWVCQIPDVTHLILTVTPWGGNLLIDKQRRHREVKHFVQSHTANRRQNQDSVSGGLDPKMHVCNPCSILCCLNTCEWALTWYVEDPRSKTSVKVLKEHHTHGDANYVTELANSQL